MKNKTLEELLQEKSQKQDTDLNQENQECQWVSISFTLTGEERRILDNYAKENYKLFGGLIREIVMKYIKRMKEDKQ